MLDDQPKKAAIFDLDKTILSTASTMAMRKPLLEVGLLKRSDSIVSTLSHMPFLLFGEAEGRNKRLRQQLGELTAGWSIDKINEAARNASISALHARCYVDTLDLIQVHKAAGHKIVIATASPHPLVEPLAEVLGADYTLATKVAIQDGLLTGEVSELNHGIEKANAVKRLAERENWDLTASWAYSDSFSDLPLLELVGNPVTINADRQLRQIARAEDWPINHFTRTVEIRPGDYITKGLLVGAVIGAATLGTYLVIHSRGRG